MRNHEHESQLANDPDLEQWLAIRKEAALGIEPGTAKVDWHWGYVLDPYGVLKLPPEAQCIGRLYFARSPDTDVWVSFYDLPSDVAKALHTKLDAGGFALDAAAADRPPGARRSVELAPPFCLAPTILHGVLRGAAWRHAGRRDVRARDRASAPMPASH